MQGREPLGHEVFVRRQRVVGQGFPVGQRRAAQRRREIADLDQQALRIGGARDHHRQRAGAVLARRELRDAFEKTRGNVLEVNFQDLHTVQNEPQRLTEWTQIAMELAEKYA